MSNTPIDEQELFTIAEVVEKLKISRPTLYRLIEKKGIEPVRIERCVRFTHEHIAQLIGAQN